MRDYDPSLGRWLSKDPILFEGDDENLYGYVWNDPVNWIDPDGKIGRQYAVPENLGGGIPSTGASSIGGIIGGAMMCDTSGEKEPKGGHSKNKRKSTEQKHQDGEARRRQDQGGDKKRQHDSWKPRNSKKKKSMR